MSSLFNLPEEIITIIFSFVPIKTLTTSVSRVCTAFYRLSESKTLWLALCREVVSVHRSPLSKIEHCTQIQYFPFGRVKKIENLWKRRYFLYAQNLLKNPYGYQEFDNWNLTEGGDGWRYNDLVAHCPVSEEAEPSFEGELNLSYKEALKRIMPWKSVSASYSWCSRSQTIDLLKCGFTSEELDNEEGPRPVISVGEWVGARTDCGSVFYIKVRLLDKQKKILGKGWKCGDQKNPKKALTRNVKVTKGETYSAKITRVIKNKEKTNRNNMMSKKKKIKKKKIKKEKKETGNRNQVLEIDPGGNNYSFALYCHRFENYPAGVRYVQFEDGSKDSKFWAGHYASMFAGPFVFLEMVNY